MRFGMLGLLTILAIVLLGMAFDAQAQQRERPPLIGYLSSAEASGFAPGRPFAYRLEKFHEGLRESGYVEGEGLRIEYRYAEGRVERLPALAAELVGLRADVIVTLGPAALKAAKGVTRSLPIVALDFESDPIAAGYVASIARPGANITGAFLDQAELSGKWLELLREAVPALARVAVLWDSATPADHMKAINMAGRALKVTMQTLEVTGLNDFEGAFVSATKGRADAMMILSSPLVSRNGGRLASLALARRLPTISMFRESATAGLLMAYGPDLAEGFRRAGSFAARILKGARPSDMPVERPTRFQLVINTRTAKALALTMPPALLARADEVIQ
jgi:putative tryptophan/tyrosine transport system substrate-binding protein